jgi:predicted transcriptional regulator
MADQLGTDERDEAAVRRFVEHMAMVFADLGFPRMPARVLMAIMSADEDTLTAADIGERLEISPAAVSGAVRYLMGLGLLVREPDPGSRRDRYRLPDDTWYQASITKAGSLKTLAALSDEGVTALGGPATRSGARLAEMRDFFSFVESEMAGLLDKWEKAKAAGA